MLLKYRTANIWVGLTAVYVKILFLVDSRLNMSQQDNAAAVKKTNVILACSNIKIQTVKKNSILFCPVLPGMVSHVLQNVI